MDQISAQDLSNILVTFLHRFAYNDTTPLPPEDLTPLDDFVLPYIPHNPKIVHELAIYVHCTFPFLPLEIRQAVAFYDAFQMSVDDIPIEQHDSLTNLCTQLSARDQIKHPVWNSFFASLPLLLRHYGPYAQTTLFRGALEFIQATCLERTLFRGYSGSNYPSYIRRMSGQGPVQAVVCFPEAEFPQREYLPFVASLEAELEDFVGTVNDLFSYYKESESAFERVNFPLNQAECSGRAVRDVLVELVDVAMGSSQRIRGILGLLGDARLSERIGGFFRGYVRYHLSCSRYKIVRLCAESGNEELARYHRMSLDVAACGPSQSSANDIQVLGSHTGCY
ncbi:Trichodiene synthase-domain-containing protein [Aspergillus karnatakaensis]|uniref:Trichodiene synthase-domain-containing protein n=1 Tax=Aspergillus karnatakaensis TaxID=1810916 RepID=UPI003CCDD603